MMGSATGVVVGATDPSASAEFLEVFGFSRSTRTRIDVADAAALYGLERPSVELVCVTPGTTAPAVHLVGCDLPGRLPADFERRARALDLYTSDMDDAIDHLRLVGLQPGPVGTLSVGPVTMRQCLVPGPDGLAVVLVESTHRRSSILDRPGAGLFSEPHSVVWCVDDMDAHSAALVSVGLTKGSDLAFTEAEVSTYLDLPRTPVPMRMTMLSGPEVEPLRLELLEFPDDPGPTPTGDTLGGGFWALRHETPGAALGAAEPLLAAGWSESGSSVSATTVVSPGGLRLQFCRRSGN